MESYYDYLKSKFRLIVLQMLNLASPFRFDSEGVECTSISQFCKISKNNRNLTYYIKLEQNFLANPMKQFLTLYLLSVLCKLQGLTDPSVQHSFGHSGKSLVLDEAGVVVQSIQKNRFGFNRFGDNWSLLAEFGIGQSQN